VRDAGGEIEEHQSVCGFEPVGCSNQCGLKVTRNRIQAHLNTVCTKRQVGGHFGGFLQCDISLAQFGQNKRLQETHRTRGSKERNKRWRPGAESRATAGIVLSTRKIRWKQEKTEQ
jgi:hypothetical protein